MKTDDFISFMFCGRLGLPIHPGTEIFRDEDLTPLSAIQPFAEFPKTNYITLKSFIVCFKIIGNKHADVAANILTSQGKKQLTTRRQVNGVKEQKTLRDLYEDISAKWVYDMLQHKVCVLFWLKPISSHQIDLLYAIFS
jgi:hypothetical protein